MKLTLRLVALVAISCLTFAKDGFFENITFDQALEKAKKENKVVFVDFYTTWCGPCKLLDRTTWKDEKVKTWLTEKTVPLKIDAEEKVELSNRYKITAYPSMAFIKPDGEKMDIIIGYRNAPDFLAEAEQVMSGKTALMRAKENLETASDDNGMARIQYGQELAKAGKHEEALKEYLTSLDHAEENPAFAPYRGYAASMVARLGRSYAPALESLKTRRDDRRAKVLEGSTDENVMAGFLTYNQALRDSKDSVKVFDQIKKRDQEAAIVKTMGSRMFSELLEEKRYEDIARYGDMQAQADRYEKLLADMKGQLDEKKIDDSQYTSMKSSMAHNLANIYQVHAGLNQFDKAEVVAKRALELDESANGYNSLAWSGYLAGNKHPMVLEHAQKAYELSNGDAYILDTLARVMGMFGQNEEAIALVEKSLPGSKGRSEKVLRECLEDLKKDAQKDGKVM